MMSRLRWLLGLGLVGIVSSRGERAIAQIQAAPDGTQTQVSINGQQFDIQGGSLSGDGANLFHSFQSFGLTAEQIANFITQPGVVNILGRVVGGDPSVINGLIQVTGGASNLYLMNPSGIIFGSQARLNVAGDFMATTATGIEFGSGHWFNTVGDPNYEALVGMPSLFAFEGVTAGAIANGGDLTVQPGQNLTLLAGQTVNTGNLSGGQVTIASVQGGDLVRLSQGDHLLSLEIERDRLSPHRSLTPLSLPELLTGATPDLGLNLTVENFPTDDGQTIISGQITGQSINGLGDRVTLQAATLNASGTHGGGTIRIGGDYRGLGNIPNAQFTTVDAASHLFADALQSGDGGRVILWADDTTRFNGTISATGIHDGGFVEVSGQQSLAFNGTVDTTGHTGERGTLLLDPENIRVISSGGAVDDTQLVDSQILASDSPGSTFIISDTFLNSIGGSNNVILAATNNISIETLGSLFVSYDLILEAGGDFSSSADLGSSVGSISITAGGNVTTQSVYTSGADIVIGAGGAIAVNGSLRTQGGEILVVGSSVDVSGDITTESSGIGGDITIVSDETLRVSGLFSSPIAGTSVSISSKGIGGDGAIALIHGGGALGIPFVVGDAGVNGTTGAIAGGGAIINPVQRFSGTTIIDGIQIITEISDEFSWPEDEFLMFDCEVIECDDDGFNEFDEAPWAEDEGWFEESEDEALEDEDSNEEDYDSDTVVNNGGAGDELGESVELDGELTQEFGNYYALGDVPSVSLAQTMDLLAAAQAETGVVPAIAYLRTLQRPLTTATIPPTKATHKPSHLTSQAPENGLEIVMVFADRPPIRRVVDTTERELQRLASQLQRAINRIAPESEIKVPARALYDRLIAPIAPDLAAAQVENISFIADAGLRSIPFAALYSGEQYLIEDFSINLMPSVSLTNLRYINLQNAPVLALGADTFLQQNPLPAVPTELKIITEDIREGEAFLNEAFTLANLQSARQATPYPIIHLATHGEFTSGPAGNSYIELWRDRLPLDRLRDLKLYDPPVELLVLSACRTALGDAEAELGFAGLAVAAGAKSALGSLWYVSDQGTLSLMTAFYEQLSQTTTRAEALRQAQLSLLNGDTQVTGGVLRTRSSSIPVNLPSTAPTGTLAHPYYWSAFTLIGSPW